MSRLPFIIHHRSTPNRYRLNYYKQYHILYLMVTRQCHTTHTTHTTPVTPYWEYPSRPWIPMWSECRNHPATHGSTTTCGLTPQPQGRAQRLFTSHRTSPHDLQVSPFSNIPDPPIDGPYLPLLRSGERGRFSKKETSGRT